MNIGYKVGELIYDANIYDGLNTFLSDLQFYKKWLPKNKEAEILEPLMIIRYYTKRYKTKDENGL